MRKKNWLSYEESVKQHKTSCLLHCGQWGDYKTTKSQARVNMKGCDFFLPLKILRERPLLVQNVQRSPSEKMRWTSDPDPRSDFPFSEKQQSMDTKFWRRMKFHQSAQSSSIAIYETFTSFWARINMFLALNQTL